MGQQGQGGATASQAEPWLAGRLAGWLGLIVLLLSSPASAQSRVLSPKVEKPLSAWLGQDQAGILGLPLGSITINKDRLTVHYGRGPRQCQFVLTEGNMGAGPHSQVGEFAVSALPVPDPGPAACLQAFTAFASAFPPPGGLWTTLAPATPLPRQITSTTSQQGIHPDGEPPGRSPFSLAPLDIVSLAYALIALLFLAVLWRSPAWRKPLAVWGSVFGIAALLISPGYRPGSHEMKETPLQFDSELGWAPVGDLIGLDAQGKPIAKQLGVHGDKPDPAKRQLLVYGDSIAEGWGLPVAENFVSQAAQMLPDWSVVNVAISGYASEQEWMYFQRHSLALRPTLVVLVYFIGNDLHGTRLENNYGTYKPHYRLQDGKLVRTNPDKGRYNCQTVLSRSTIMWPLWKAATLGRDDDRDRLSSWVDVICGLERLTVPEAIGVQYEIFRRFRDDVAKAGGQLVVVISPTSVLMERGKEHIPPGLTGHHETYEAIQKSLRTLNIPTWDWLQVLQRESPWCGSAGTAKHVCDQERVFLDGGHYTKQASAWLGRWLATAASEAAKTGPRNLP